MRDINELRPRPNDGQVSSRRSLIKWLISDDLGRGHNLETVTDSW